MMDRNTDRYYYDQGYSLGVTETQRDAIPLRLIGAWVLFAFVWWRPAIAAVFLGIYTVWTYSDYRDRVREARHKREHCKPGKRYEYVEE